jgi:UDP-N-acetylmuramate: L-alanyl-gamma-D-glutamyl-meso-diaminopimelate ligase
MSTQLTEQDIELIEGFGAEQLSLKPDLFIIGNVVSRGNPLMEAILNAGAPYTSGPQWLGQHVLPSQHVLAVAGTHGKTTTSSMLTWVLKQNGLHPNFLIGGVAHDLKVSALFDAAQRFFVIEADEYDTAFFDKRSKFVHYRPRTAVLNNLEYDHADIFPDLAAIETQFHHLVRTVPAAGIIIMPDRSASLERVIARGCWTPVIRTKQNHGWHARTQADPSQASDIYLGDQQVGSLTWGLTGQHNIENALVTLAAAQHVNIEPGAALAALNTFQGVKRRMEFRGQVMGVTVYDDFAHHPTAIATTVAGLRQQVGSARILAVLEPRSNTMKLGTMAAQLPQALKMADLVFCFGETTGKNALGWQATEVLAPLGDRASVWHDIALLVAALAKQVQPGDHVLIMSNGSFGGIHDKLLKTLADQS